MIILSSNISHRDLCVSWSMLVLYNVYSKNSLELSEKTNYE
jgi:hypothetical protein